MGKVQLEGGTKRQNTVYQLKWNDFSKRYKLDNNKINEENFKKANKLDLSSRGCGDIILNDLFPLITLFYLFMHTMLGNNFFIRE